MTDPESPAVDRALQEAAVRVEKLYAELLDAHPALRGSLAIPGVLIGHGLTSFVASGMTDDQIVMHVLTSVLAIRGMFDPAPRCS